MITNEEFIAEVLRAAIAKIEHYAGDIVDVDGYLVCEAVSNWATDAAVGYTIGAGEAVGAILALAQDIGIKL